MPSGSSKIVAVEPNHDRIVVISILDEWMPRSFERYLPPRSRFLDGRVTVERVFGPFVLAK